MAKETKKLAVRVSVNVVASAIILAVLTNLFASLSNSIGRDSVLVSSVISLIVLLWLVPRTFKKHPGEETLLSFILALPVGFVIVNLINTIFRISLPIIDIGNVSFGSMQFILALTSYVIADTLYLKVTKSR